MLDLENLQEKILISRLHQPVSKTTSARVHLFYEEYDEQLHICHTEKGTENCDPVTFLEIRTAVESKLVYYYRALQVHEESFTKILQHANCRRLPSSQEIYNSEG